MPGTLPAGIPAAGSQALTTAPQESWRRQRVLENAETLRDGLRSLGCDIRGEGHIVPWFIGHDEEVDHVSHVLEEQGVFASAIRFPAVARGEAIVRFMMMATHTEEHIERTLDCLRNCVARRTAKAVPRAGGTTAARNSAWESGLVELPATV
jgi:8-amino-7-oxononanoate synthase